MRRYSCRKFREEPLSGPARFVSEALIIETNLEASTEGCRALSFRPSRGSRISDCHIEAVLVMLEIAIAPIVAFALGYEVYRKPERPH